MDSKALAERLDTLSQRTRLDHEYIDLGAEELLIMLLTAKSAMRQAARILRDVVPQLKRYAQHTDECAVFEYLYGPVVLDRFRRPACTCGFDQMVAALDALEPLR